MSTPSQPDPRADQAVFSDDKLLASHEALLGSQPDEKGKYRLLPLNLLFIFSGMIFFGGTYLGRFSGHFDARVFNEYSGPPKSGDAPAAVDPVVAGKKLYAIPGACITCHQPNGAGLPGAFPTLVNSEWVLGSEERLVRIVLHGVTGPIKVAGVDYNSAMPGFGPTGLNWSDDKVANVLTYIRQEWGNKAGPISAEKVAAVRAKEAARKTAWTAAELEKLP